MDTQSAVECKIIKSVIVMTEYEISYIEEKVSADAKVVEALLKSTF